MDSYVYSYYLIIKKEKKNECIYGVNILVLRDINGEAHYSGQVKIWFRTKLNIILFN